MVASAQKLFVWRHFINRKIGNMSQKTKLPTQESALPGRLQPLKVSALRSSAALKDCSGLIMEPSGFLRLLLDKSTKPYGWLVARKHSEAREKHHVNGNRTTPPFLEGMHTAVFGLTGHVEVVRVVFEPAKLSYEKLLKVFWENHDPTQGMRQGNDVGTEYRSAIYTHSPEQMRQALESRDAYQKVLAENGFGKITTEIREGQEFYYAEDYHQQYLSKNPQGYCGLGGTGVSCPIGLMK
ncbi:mitochondrial peptide methionine sulfoxide reductase isoform X2 [Brienomyrus brachyistius]|uniref:mitochondrial peptide methionine sulfoxide reductase isoform X2 n=1 Tax=Brienomyrus brachyistius TaxID=42636 RepID=UPI0020B3006C|nr:mitochondrial peptide methionine sulfoxide reductase isoform X2 [Brienomyrus brachyistius]